MTASKAFLMSKSVYLFKSSKLIFTKLYFNDFKVSGKCINFTLSTNPQYLGVYDKNIFGASGRYGAVAATTHLCSEEGHD